MSRDATFIQPLLFIHHGGEKVLSAKFSILGLFSYTGTSTRRSTFLFRYLVCLLFFVFLPAINVAGKRTSFDWHVSPM